MTIIEQPNDAPFSCSELAKARLVAAWTREMGAARDSRYCRDATTAWMHLERAHILSQPLAGRHVRTHLAMLGHGLRSRDRREVLGQVARVLVAGPGSWSRRYPEGNSGGTSVSAFAVMEIPADLRPVLTGFANAMADRTGGCVDTPIGYKVASAPSSAQETPMITAITSTHEETS